MRIHPDFKTQVMQSSYVDPLGKENLMEVVHRWGSPFNSSAMYAHMKRHQATDIAKIEAAMPKLDVPLEILKGDKSDDSHLRALDDFINKGWQKLASGDLPITAATWMKAIHERIDYDSKNKDRQLDAFKMMKGAYSGPSQAERGTREG